METNTEKNTFEIEYELFNESNFNNSNMMDGFKEFVYIEEDLLEILDDDFEYHIKQRGIEYYESGNVIKVIKNISNKKTQYHAKVKGTHSQIYNVAIDIDEYGVEYKCSCPCTFPCKHNYAVLKDITNKEYEVKQLKPLIKETEINIKSIIATIPAEELKKYLLESNDINFNLKSFENNFKKYYPDQKYEYYYNNLYNTMVFDNGYEELINIYLKTIKQYISVNNFKEVFKIIKSIINAYHDSNNINIDEYFTDILPSIGMYLRVVYRKSNEKLRNQIIAWITELENQNYYNNYYLEDIILNIKFLNIEYII